MNINRYWHLISASDEPKEAYIVELTEDGIAYIWPVMANTDTVSVDRETDQDLDSFLIDGDFVEYFGYFTGIIDFMIHSVKYTPDRFVCVPLGEFASIRYCRAAMSN